ncbi:MAG: hypothetical protein GTN82_32310 [Candidatus Aminicenantes bacterium]|nr:hypothetical protein [Candidatus Aminicenantes bacterium]
MKKGIFLFIVLTSLVFSAKTVSLPDLKKPVRIKVDRDGIYINDSMTISIYSLKDFHLVKRFGKKGEGPREFKQYINLNVQPHSLVITSVAKVSYFTKKGEFIKELRVPKGWTYKPLGKHFVGNDFVQDENTLYKAVYLYDSKFDRIKELSRKEFPFQRAKSRFRVYSTPVDYWTGNNKVFICGKEDFIIDVFDGEGNQLASLKEDYEKIKLSENHKNGIYDFFKKHPYYKTRYEWFKKQLVFPDQLPAIRSFFISQQKLFVRTYRKKKDKTEFFIFDMNGKFIKKRFLPVIERNVPTSFPFWIYDGKLYQLYDNPETGSWELQVTGMEKN